MKPDLKKNKNALLYIYIAFFCCNILKYFFKNKLKSKLKMGLHTIVVHTILVRMVFFFSSEIKIERLDQFWVRPA